MLNPISLLVLLVSVILHELAHGYSALYFGDDTAKRAGRLTLDPLAHVDLIGTVLVPMACLIFGSPVFGWAKPVPVNINALPGRKAEIWVSLAGILVNFALAIIATLGIRLMILYEVEMSSIVFMILMAAVQINILLAVFNLMPIPPLDGWRIWGVWLPEEWRMRIEENSMMFMLILYMLMPFLVSILVAPITRMIFKSVLIGV